MTRFCLNRKYENSKYGTSEYTDATDILYHVLTQFDFVVCDKKDNPNASIFVYTELGQITQILYLYSKNLSEKYPPIIKSFINPLNGLKVEYNERDYFFTSINYKNYFRLVDYETVVDGSLYPLPSNYPEFVDTFSDCYIMQLAPTIPNGVLSCKRMFINCYKLQRSPKIPRSVIDVTDMFYNCYDLQYAPKLPANIDMLYNTFAKCTSLLKAPKLPNTIKYTVSAFDGCTSLIKAPKLPSKLKTAEVMYAGCENLEEVPYLPKCLRNAESMFLQCHKLRHKPILPLSLCEEPRINSGIISSVENTVELFFVSYLKEETKNESSKCS